MNLKQIIYFLVFGTGSLLLLLHFAGGFDEHTPQGVRNAATQHHDPSVTDLGNEDTQVGPGFGVGTSKALRATAKPELLIWRDPANPDLVVEIPSFIRWEFRAGEMKPRRVGSSDRLAVLCQDVEMLTYREPRTLVEARALRSGNPSQELRASLVHRRFVAGDATAYGRLAATLDKGGPSVKTPIERDTEIRFHGRVFMQDRIEGIVVHCEDDSEITVFPKEESVYGTGHFRVEHQAFRIRGKGIELSREAARTKVEIRENPHFELTGGIVDQSAGGLLAGGTDRRFRPTTIDSRGRFLLRQVETEDGVRVVLDFRDRVLVEQVGGRQLRAQHLIVHARQRESATSVRKKDARPDKERYDFERLIGHQIELHLRPPRPDSKRPMIAMKARRLTYTMPEDGIATALLEGNPDIRMRGRMPLADGSQGVGLLRARCSRRAWFGPDRKTAVPFGLKIDRIRRITLEGDARIERIDTGSTPFDDVIEGDQIDMTCLAVEDPFRRENQRMQNPPPGAPEIVPLSFVADGHVRIESERLAGTSSRIVGLLLHTEQPRVRIGAPGETSQFSFRQIAGNQRLLGANPEPPTPNAGRGGVSSPAPAQPAQDTWVVKRMEARGEVGIRTALGGPTLGIASRLQGEVLTYEDGTGVARFVGAPGRPAHLQAESAAAGKQQEITAPEFTLDRQAGLVTADGGITSRVWVDLEGGRPGQAGDLVRQAPSQAANTLDVDTTGRIDLTLVRVGQTLVVRRDAEQVVRINGPFTAELKADDQVHDSLRANELTLRLALTKPKTGGSSGMGIPGVTARPAGASGSSSTPSRRRAPARPTQLSLVTLEARTVTVRFGKGGAERLEATGGVDLDSTLGHVWGERIVYQAGQRLIEVFGTAARVAEARFGEQGPKSHLRAERFELHLGTKGAERMSAIGVPRRPVLALLARPASGRPGAFEMIRIRSSTGLSLDEQGMTGTAVQVVRTLRTAGGKMVLDDKGQAASPVLTLWADYLRVQGEGLLSSRDPQITAIVAERREKDTVVDLGPQGARARLLGDRLRFDMAAQVLTMTGTRARPVEFRSPEAEGDYQQVQVDMKRGTVSVGGGEVIWRNR